LSKGNFGSTGSPRTAKPNSIGLGVIDRGVAEDVVRGAAVLVLPVRAE
jgi:hypothetical protein